MFWMLRIPRFATWVRMGAGNAPLGNNCADYGREALRQKPDCKRLRLLGPSTYPCHFGSRRHRALQWGSHHRCLEIRPTSIRVPQRKKERRVPLLRGPKHSTILLATSPLAAIRSAPTIQQAISSLRRTVAAILSHMTCTGTPLCCSSQAVRRDPCKRGRVSSANTAIFLPCSWAAYITPVPLCHNRQSPGRPRYSA